jgi:hypothetical protein
MLTAHSHKNWTAALIITAAAFVGAWFVSGCASGDAPPSAGAAAPSTQPSHAGMFESTSHKSGNQLWSENCSRCHNIRPPEYYSDAQWDIIVHHMRLRANLSGEEQRKISEFLRASN